MISPLLRQTRWCVPADRPGFTLIELLVSISIIALLIAILLPVLSQAQEAARSVLCLSKERQVGLLFHYYHSDYQERYPLRYSVSGDLNTYWHNVLRDNYHTAIEGNLQSEAIFSCPSKPVDVWFRTSYIHYGYNANFIGMSYFRGAEGGTAFGSTMKPARVDEITKPSQTILLVDSFLKSAPTRGWFVVDSKDGTSTGTGYPEARHAGSVNTLWADGHATTVKCSTPENPYTQDALTEDDNSIVPSDTKDSLWDRR